MEESAYHHGDLRTALLEAAEDELRKDPGCALSVRSLASKIGVSPTAPHAHFKTKSDLLAALASRGFQTLHEELLMCSQGTQNTRYTLNSLAECYLSFGTKNVGLYRLMFTTGVDLDANADLRQTSRAAFEVLRDVIREALPDSAAIETDAHSVTAWALVHGFVSLLNEDRIADDIMEDRSVSALAEIATDRILVGTTHKLD